MALLNPRSHSIPRSGEERGGHVRIQDRQNVAKVLPHHDDRFASYRQPTRRQARDQDTPSAAEDWTPDTML